MDVKIGDEAILFSGKRPKLIVVFSGQRPKLIVVDRITRTTFCADGYRFSMRDGYMHGQSSWSRPLKYARIAEQDAKDRIDHARGGLRTLRVTPENVAQVEAFIADMKQQAAAARNGA